MTYSPNFVRSGYRGGDGSQVGRLYRALGLLGCDAVAGVRVLCGRAMRGKIRDKVLEPLRGSCRYRRVITVPLPAVELRRRGYRWMRRGRRGRWATVRGVS